MSLNQLLNNLDNIKALPAELALERPGSDALVLPHVVVEVALGDEGALADLALVGLLVVVLDADVLVDARLVEHLVADRARRVQRALLVLGHKVLLVPQPHVPSQAANREHIIACYSCRGTLNGGPRVA